MRHVTRYRIHPSRKAVDRLFSAFRQCTFVRNWCLDNRVFTDSCLPPLKTEYPDLKEVCALLDEIIAKLNQVS